MNPIRNIVTVVALAALLGGCNSFDKDFEAAAAAQSTYIDVTGPWVGEWRSEANDHSGPMRAIITQIGDGLYMARYEATWKKIFIFHQDVELREAPTATGVTANPDMRSFLGSEDLGVIWGVYHYKAKATSTQFNSTYRSEDDHGVYKLTRP